MPQPGMPMPRLSSLTPWAMMPKWPGAESYYGFLGPLEAMKYKRTGQNYDPMERLRRISLQPGDQLAESALSRSMGGGQPYDPALARSGDNYWDAAVQAMANRKGIQTMIRGEGEEEMPFARYVSPRADQPTDPEFLQEPTSRGYWADMGRQQGFDKDPEFRNELARRLNVAPEAVTPQMYERYAPEMVYPIMRRRGWRMSR